MNHVLFPSQPLSLFSSRDGKFHQKKILDDAGKIERTFVKTTFGQCVPQLFDGQLGEHLAQRFNHARRGLLVDFSLNCLSGPVLHVVPRVALKQSALSWFVIASRSDNSRLRLWHFAGLNSNVAFIRRRLLKRLVGPNSALGSGFGKTAGNVPICQTRRIGKLRLVIVRMRRAVSVSISSSETNWLQIRVTYPSESHNNTC